MMAEDELKKTSPDFSVTVEIPNLEAAVIAFLGSDFKKMDHDSISKALEKLYNLLGTEESSEGRLLVYAICEALTDKDSYWKLTLTHRGGKGQGIKFVDKASQLTRDVLALKIYEEQTADGIKRDAVYAYLEDQLGLSESGVRAVLKRAREQKL